MYSFLRTNQHLRSFFASVAIAALMLTIFPGSIVNIAEAEQPVRIFSVEVTPDTINVGDTDEFVFTINNEIQSDEALKSVRITAPAGFVLTNPVVSISGWDAEVTGTQIEASDEGNPSALLPGEVMTITVQVENLSASDSADWEVCASKNSSFSSGGGAAFDVLGGSGCADVEVSTPASLNTQPVITLTGSSTINLTVGDSYTESGATANDAEDGDITGDIVIGGDTVDTATPGTYTVIYNVTDSKGLAASEVTRTVVVAAAESSLTGSISGTKYEDTDNNGSIADEPTSAGWTIRLYEEGTPWELVATTTTATDGTYEFSAVPEGTYKVCEVLQAGWTQTFVSNGSANASPNVSEEGARCQTANITNDGDSRTVNFGNYFDSSAAIDVCPNIEGNQSVVPTGYIVNQAGDCVEDVEPVEFCSFAGTVVETTPDADVVVDANRRDVTAVENGPASYQNTSGKEGNDWVVGDFFSLGIGGFLTYEFTGQVAEGDGTGAADIAIYEITGGNGANTEEIEVLVSEDGVIFTSVGTFVGDAYVDIDGAGLGQVRFVKLVDMTTGGPAQDGYDVDAIVILNGNCATPDTPPAPIATIEVCKFIGETAQAGWLMTLTNGTVEDEIEALTGEDGCVEIEFDPTKGPWNVLEETREGYAQSDVQATGTYMSVVASTEQSELYPEMCQVALAEQNLEYEGLGCDFVNTSTEVDNEDGDGSTSEDDSSSGRSSSGSTGTRIGARSTNAAPQGQVLGAADSLQCEMFITEYMRMGAVENRHQVVNLQAFLMGYMGYDVDLTAEFDAATEAAVRTFQATYQDEILTPWLEIGLMSHNNPTGYAYMLTRWKINNLMCPGSEAYPAELR